MDGRRESQREEIERKKIQSTSLHTQPSFKSIVYN
jgi:hypothetical protein